MSTLTQPFNFTAGTYAVASQVDANFSTIYGWVNSGNAVWADASRAFTGIPVGPAADPTTGNQFARKAYVDGFLQCTNTAGADANQFFKVKWGIYQCDSAATGLASIPFGNPFPSACQFAIAQFYGSGGSDNIIVNVNTVNATFLSVFAQNPTNLAPYAGLFWASFIAIGF